MRILVFTRSEWDDQNGIGNTMSNLFGDIPKKNIANFYVRDALPNNDVCSYYYSISDKDVIKGLIKKKYTVGHKFTYDNLKSIENLNHITLEKKLYSFLKSKSTLLGLELQNYIWKKNGWKNDNLNKFLDDFKPDIIFSPSFHTIFTHRILWYLKKKTGAKLILFHADDYLNPENYKGYLEKKYFLKRESAIIKSINMASINYCISDKQSDEYSRIFKREMKVLTKGGNFDYLHEYRKNENNTITLSYTGSIYYGRWKTLALLAKCIQKINFNSNVKFILEIYSQYTPTKDILEKIEIPNASSFKGGIPSDEVMNVMLQSDIVVHLESFEEEEKNQTRLSFSTKIVDCFESGRTLFAIGDKEAASIEYLKKNDVALIANNSEEIESVLIEIKNDTSILEKYAKKSWEFGKDNHGIKEIRKNFYDNLENIL